MGTPIGAPVEEVVGAAEGEGLVRDAGAGGVALNSVARAAQVVLRGEQTPAVEPVARQVLDPRGRVARDVREVLGRVQLLHLLRVARERAANHCRERSAARRLHQCVQHCTRALHVNLPEWKHYEDSTWL